MKHVIGRLRGVVKGNGNIAATLTEMDIREGLRPKTAEDFGASPEALAVINRRKPGTEFETFARPGAGVALVVSDMSAFLNDEKDNFLTKIGMRWGESGPQALLGPVRDFDAPGDFLRQDICAGIVEVENLAAAAFSEMIEMGFYREDGYARPMLPKELTEYQAVVDRELTAEWNRLVPGFPMRYEVSITMRPGARDNINGLDCVLSTEPLNGSVEIILLGEVQLEGRGWRVRDTEHRHDTGTALNRIPMLIAPRYRYDNFYNEQDSPIQIALGPNGFDRTRFQTILTQRQFNNYANDKVKSALSALGWLTRKR